MVHSPNLVIDVGGTNTRMALSINGTVDQSSIIRFRNDDLASIEDGIVRFRGQNTASINAVCACLAGPVRNRIGVLTNRDWSISENSLAEAAGATVGVLLNDLQAQGYAVAGLNEAQVQTLKEGDPVQNDTRLVVNVGTGFNAAVVFQTTYGQFVPPSESGHAGLPVSNAATLGLAEALASIHGFAAVEDALSGRGLERVHGWHTERQVEHPPKSSQEIFQATDKPSVEPTIQSFMQLLGAVTGDLALIHLPFSGIYMVGGLAHACAPYFTTGAFETAFLDKGRFGEMLAPIPVFLVTDDYAALQGCATHLRATLKG